MQAIFSNWLYILTGIFLIVFRAESITACNPPGDSSLIFVFNQPAYAPGDTAYFSGYLLQGNNQKVGSKQMVGIRLSGLSDELIYHGRVLFQDGRGISQIIIPENIEPGNYQFVAYIETSNQAKRPAFYVSNLRISSREVIHTDDRYTTYPMYDSSRLRIRTDRDKYGRRSKVSVTVTPTVNMNKLSMTVVSIAVYNEQLFLDSTNHKVMSTVLPVRIEPGTGESSEPSKVFDFPDYFTGKAFIKSTGMAVPDSSKITFYLNESDFAYVVYTSSGGNFSFPLFKNFGTEEIFYRIYHKGNLLSDSQITVYDTQVNVEGRRSDAIDAYGLYAKQKRIIDKSYRYFASKGNKDDNENKYESDVEADNEIQLDKFESFPSMAEVFGNIIPSVRYRKIGDEERVRIFLKETTKYGDNNPLYIVDGTMTDDTKYILSLDPKLVRKIGVLRSEETLVRFGDLGLDGILLIETDITDTREIISKSENSLSVIGIDKTIEYKKVIYNQDMLKSRTPDLRSSLYWNPNADFISLQSFDFYTSDDIGPYIIQISGLIDGKPFFSTKRFYVTHRVDE